LDGKPAGDSTSTTRMIAKQRILILGESPLVEEYASLCHNKGFAVSVRLNPEFSNVKLPKGLTRAAKPTRNTHIALELTNTDLDVKKTNLGQLDKSLSSGTPILSSSITVTVSEQASWISRPERLIGLGALPSFLQNELIEFSESSETGKPTREAAERFSSTIGKKTAFVADSVGLVLPRILCMLANEACFAMAENVAAGTDIDTAMRLGTNYPLGPVEWAQKIGARQVHAVVSALYSCFHEDRYRPSPILALAARRNTFAGL